MPDASKKTFDKPFVFCAVRRCVLYLSMAIQGTSPMQGFIKE